MNSPIRNPVGIRILKRLCDIIIAACTLAVLSPVIAFVAILIANRIGRPVIFRQTRPGLNGKPFTLLKFRTMTEVRDAGGRLLHDEQRMTNIGTKLRRLSLDEIPEFVNILRGDMSIVGPRPLLVAYLDRYTADQARRHEVRPGLTGWAQVHGRNLVSWEERLRMDVWYVDHWSLGLDVQIILATFGAVLRHDGISAEGCATAPEFMGKAGQPHQ
jgi:lipopolysaccharide/colanic/teichoic acid biosynthesis glycosyltransferase